MGLKYPWLTTWLTDNDVLVEYDSLWIYCSGYAIGMDLLLWGSKNGQNAYFFYNNSYKTPKRYKIWLSGKKLQTTNRKIYFTVLCNR